VAIQALSFLAEDSTRIGRFVEATGIAPAAIRSAAQDPFFLVGVLDHMASDEALLVAFARSVELRPEIVIRAREVLGGQSGERNCP
jgi:hypothetical protein